eukprot:TRINITY_DN10721_c0_g1_i2.p1 TRINITY_DN10721_c0_g1~~TRINITY_DN10721_c0_g1_i2.p1  ORF type:complete len:186 (+),score=38.14 TRINITY_DN10721_c0_g1_i2:127-684(+)
MLVGVRAIPRRTMEDPANRRLRSIGNHIGLSDRGDQMIGSSGSQNAGSRWYSTKKPVEKREDYKHLLDIQTRWKDNDGYGHVNNVEYYSYFDTVVNEYMIGKGQLDIHDQSENAIIGVVAETQCRFFSSISFPEVIQAGLRVAHLGKTSVKYEIGIFCKSKPEAGRRINCQFGKIYRAHRNHHGR